MRDMTPEQQFEVLLDYLRRSHGFDFTGYKRSNLMRRITKRMHTVGIQDYAAYLDFLEVHPEEFQPLFNTVLINVTGFFRDPESWAYVASEVLPRILERKGSDDFIRVWSAGCASGEEAYTAAILLGEAIGVRAFTERVKLFATDVDEEALVRARAGCYTERDLDAVDPQLVERYFERSTDQRFCFHKEMRRSVIFGRHDLTQDAPISRVDLLICRNTLMYFNAETQARVLARFHFALGDSGYLFLGRAEMLLTHANLFVPVDMKHRVFARVPRAISAETILGPVPDSERGNHLVSNMRFREVAFDLGPVPQIVVDMDGVLALANQQARSLFGVSPRDVGRPLKDLEISYRPVELRGPIDRAIEERHPVTIRDVVFPTPDGPRHVLDVQITPLLENHGPLLGVSIVFTDVTRHKLLQEELQQARQDLETAYEELQSAHEELETTNEELQSTVEELETTNEELQSSNEELETMNEELQSTNEELETINHELRQRTGELNDANLFLEGILSGLGGGVVVLDGNLQVRIWNRTSEDLWGLHADEVEGKHFLDLDIGLPVAALRTMIRSCLANEPTPDVIVDAVNRRGKQIRCRARCSPLTGAGGVRRGVILMVEEV